MPKPVCPKCQRFFRPEKNGEWIVEQKPITSPPRPGNMHPEDWDAYKLWQGDRWKCHGCGAEIIVGFGQRPWAEHFEPDFWEKMHQARKEMNRHLVRVNDC